MSNEELQAQCATLRRALDECLNDMQEVLNGLNGLDGDPREVKRLENLIQVRHKLALEAARSGKPTDLESLLIEAANRLLHGTSDDTVVDPFLGRLVVTTARILHLFPELATD